ncbi:MAG: DCC1-like thiol-disulfide oxidoreductase family protein [Ilumatobacteraceae bacterium]
MSASIDTGRPVLVFDGECGFCTSSAGFGRRWLGLEHVEPWQRLDLATLGLSVEQCEAAVQWVAEDGTVASAEDAVVGALRYSGGVWSALGRAIDLPGVHRLAGVAYRWVAEHRGSLPGGTPALRQPGAGT